jgi:predicted ATP-dependent serine protease
LTKKQREDRMQSVQNQSEIQSIKSVKRAEIPILKGTVFDIFGGLPQAFIGITGEPGCGKSQVVLRLVADISNKKMKTLVILTEQSPSRWKTLLETRYRYNPEHIDVIYKGFIDENFFRDLRKSKYQVVVIDSVSGAVTEQKARQVAKAIRNLSEFYGKWVIGVFQVRGSTSHQVAGGEGVEHMIEISYELVYFQLKPQNRWLHQGLREYGYRDGDYVRLIRNCFDKIRGVQNTNLIVLDIDKNGRARFIELKRE